jgi:23S rRNA pseudouridine1911/1915/1917 synthase
LSDIEILITGEMSGRRLDSVLHDAAPEFSRSALRKAILAGQCNVDGLPEPRPDIRAKAGQRVLLRLVRKSGGLVAEEGHLEVLWQDRHFVVCNKPAGLTVHPCPSCPEHTLAQRLLGRFPQLAEIDGPRPGIVHRLDKNTSGLLLVALDERARLAMSEVFARREVKKEYLALVSGTPPVSGQCREPLGRHPAVKTKMAVLAESRGGKSAHTEWKRLWTTPGQADQGVSLLSVRIHTGRTHQIRVHLAHLGHHLLGDRLYAPKPVRARAPRQMLHAWKLAFTHPHTGEELHFCCPPPEDMPAAALAACRRMRRVVVVGNPGSGKSTFTKCLEKLGVPVFSADALVSALYAPGGEAAVWIGRRSGALLGADGAVDKNALFSAMRGDAVLRADIEAVVHGFVRVAVEDFWAKQEAAGTPLAVAELPLYLECGWQTAFSPAPFVVGVSCPLPLRIQRVMVTRGWSEEKAASLESWQWSESRKEAACDALVDNSGGIETMDSAAHGLLEILERLRLETEKERGRELENIWRQFSKKS